MGEATPPEPNDRSDESTLRDLPVPAPDALAWLRRPFGRLRVREILGATPSRWERERAGEAAIGARRPYLELGRDGYRKQFFHEVARVLVALTEDGAGGALRRFTVTFPALHPELRLPTP